MKRFPHSIVLIAMSVAALLATTSASASNYDPPGRVARLSHSQGELSFSPSGEDDWYNVHRNRPLVRGDRLWTDRNARAELQVGSAAVRLDETTHLEILELNDRLVQLEVSEGSINLHVRRLYSGQEFEIATPNLAFVITQSGDYRIDVDPRNEHTTVTIWHGKGVAYGDRRHFSLYAGQAVRFYDDDLYDNETFGLPRMDDFDRYCSRRDTRLSRSISLRYLDDDVIGYSDLDDYGSWRPNSRYGNVWYPNHMDANWAPYRDGQWIWQEPWGWTWVDDAPWGFAPSHYGRWVNIANHWGWIPGPRHHRPVYAPALVVFLGGHGWSLSISLGGDVSIGWFPLGPHDVYLPPYQASRPYFAQINVSNTTINNTTINNVYNNYSTGTINVNQTNYVNRLVGDAVTAVPANVFVNSRPVRPATVRLDRNAIRKGELTRVAPITPRAHSVSGTASTANIRPPREALERRVFARTPPPASERPFVDREKLLQQNPGRAVISRPEPRAQDIERRNIRVIQSQTDAIKPREKDLPRENAVPPQQLDRSNERRRPAANPRDEHRDVPITREQSSQEQSDADADAQAKNKIQAAELARKRARDEAKMRADANARAEQQAQIEAAQAEENTRADARHRARVEAQTRADAEANPREDKNAPTEATTSDTTEQQSKREQRESQRADRAQQRQRRQPLGCLTTEEINALKQHATQAKPLPNYVLCENDGNR